jgi:hypothetical protein
MIEILEPPGLAAALMEPARVWTIEAAPVVPRNQAAPLVLKDEAAPGAAGRRRPAAEYAAVAVAASPGASLAAEPLAQPSAAAWAVAATFS